MSEAVAEKPNVTSKEWEIIQLPTWQNNLSTEEERKQYPDGCWEAVARGDVRVGGRHEKIVVRVPLPRPAHDSRGVDWLVKEAQQSGLWAKLQAECRQKLEAMVKAAGGKITGTI